MAETSTERITALLSGRVQGVGMRVFAQRTAQDLGIAGYAENLTDGRVEIVAEGHRDDLELFLVKLRNGPAHSEVRDVEVTWGEAGGLKGFYVY